MKLQKYLTNNEIIFNSLNYAKPIYINGEITKYYITIEGKVYNSRSKKILKSYHEENRYCYVGLNHNGKTYCKLVHRLVAKAFIENPENKPEVNHKDGDKTNNVCSNLEWVTPKENMEHASKNNLLNTRTSSYYSFDSLMMVAKLLEENKMSISEISKETGVKKDTIYDIKNCTSWQGLSNFYDVSKYTSKTQNKYSDEEYERVFSLLESGEYSVSTISKKMNIPKTTIYNMLFGYSHSKLKEKYNIEIEKIKYMDTKKYSDESIKEVCEYFVENKLTPSEISEKTGIPKNYILNILNHKKRKNISSRYDFRNYDKKINRNEYDKKILDEIDNLLIKGYRNRDIQRIIFNDKEIIHKSLINNRKISLRKQKLVN